MKINIKALSVLALASISSLFLSGCYIPEGTKQITGGSGPSAEAYLYLPQLSDSGPTQFHIEINALIEGEKATKGSDQVTYGSVNVTDTAYGVMMQGTIIAREAGALFCAGRIKKPGVSKWIPVNFIVGAEQDFEKNLPPGLSNKANASNFRHAAAVLVFEQSIQGPPVAAWIGFFSGGNFVFHGDKGVILR